MIPAEETSGSFFFNQHEAWRGPNSKAIIFYVIYVHYRLTNLTCWNMWSHPPYPIYVDRIFRQPWKELLQLDKSCWSINSYNFIARVYNNDALVLTKKVLPDCASLLQGLLSGKVPGNVSLYRPCSRSFKHFQPSSDFEREAHLFPLKTTFTLKMIEDFNEKRPQMQILDGITFHSSWEAYFDTETLLLQTLCYRAVVPIMLAQKQ